MRNVADLGRDIGVSFPWFALGLVVLVLVVCFGRRQIGGMRLIWRLEILEFEEREHRSNSRRCHARTPSLSLLWPAGMARLRPTTLLCNIHNVRTIIAWRWSTGALVGRISVGRSNL